MSFTAEVLEQPAVLRKTLEGLASLPDEFCDFARRLQEGEFTHLLFSGMGASYAARYPFLAFLNQHGVTAFGVDTSELLHYRQGLIKADTALLLVSQSGESVELLRLAEARRRRGFVVTLTNGPDNSLARLGDLALSFPAGPERTVSTKTYTCTLAALALMAGALVGDQGAQLAAMVDESIEAVEEYLSGWSEATQELVQALAPGDNLILLGRGPSLASASCGAVVLKETAHLAAEALGAGEFRHGPLEAANPAWPIILFMPPGRTFSLMARLATELLDYGVPVAVVGPERPDPRAIHVCIRGLPEWVSPIAEIVPIQTLAYGLAKARGLEPGHFGRMGKITQKE